MSTMVAATSEVATSSTSTLEDYVPSLYDLVDHTTTLDSTPNTSEFSLSSFYNYLLSRHCSENLEFILDINHYLSLPSPSLANWQHVFDKYLTFDADLEINLPCKLRSQLQMSEFPQVGVLLQSKKYIYDNLLVGLYQDFTRQIKNDKLCTCKRRTSDTVLQKQAERQPLKHSLSLSLPQRVPMDEDVCPISPITSPLHKQRHTPSLHRQQSLQNHHHQHHHTTKTKHYVGYDYYTIPSTESSSEGEEQDCLMSKNNSRNNSTSSSSRGSSIGSIMDSSIVYLTKMKKFKFGRRFSNEDQ
ncbi:hypothetical protein G210_0583 [Candida maltosa Xu316]|uniref:RGS domain-containing protein n=1 Tax=Candida maltosa (strain Xu316) TaxID=1245528 RepID=M3IQN6_CANMX|nr:hypothetical protein G210_0583 [Candida maltosa Xu316]